MEEWQRKWTVQYIYVARPFSSIVKPSKNTPWLTGTETPGSQSQNPRDPLWMLINVLFRLLRSTELHAPWLVETPSLRCTERARKTAPQKKDRQAIKGYPGARVNHRTGKTADETIALPQCWTLTFSLFRQANWEGSDTRLLKPSIPLAILTRELPAPSHSHKRNAQRPLMKWILSSHITQDITWGNLNDRISSVCAAGVSRCPQAIPSVIKVRWSFSTK